MSNAVLKGHASGTGTVTLETPNTNTDRTISFPDSTGTVVLSDTTPSLNGIAFPATQSASADANTLDDYEEGTFSPYIDSLVAGTGRSSIVYTGKYTKIGRICNFQIFVGLTTLGSGGSGLTAIKGLPFTSLNDGGSYESAISVGYFEALASSIVWIGGTVKPNNTYAAMFVRPTASTDATSMTFSTYMQAGSALMISGTYIVA